MGDAAGSRGPEPRPAGTAPVGFRAPMPADDPAAPVPERPEAPPVVAVVLTRGDRPTLVPTLEALAAQRYDALSVLLVAHDGPDALTESVAAAAPGAFVRRVEKSSSYADMANQALTSVEGAHFLLFLHDDVALDPDALARLIEEAYRSNAGIIGPKLVSADDERVLVDVGQSIDRFAAARAMIEPGERDQEQHDAVRDVFFVSGAAMLVRTDLMQTLGGFDPLVSPGVEDLDLCWRARLVGARVLVAPDSRARHAATAADDRIGPRTRPREYERHRLRVFLKNYSAHTLLWLAPAFLIVTLLESVVFLFTRRATRARAVVGAWFWNLRRLGSLRKDRRAVKRQRRVTDSDLRFLQVRGSARAARYLGDKLHAQERLAELENLGQNAMEGAGRRTRTPVAIGWIALGLVLLVGQRDLFFGSVANVGSLLEWPATRELFGAFTSGWRFSGLGAAAPAPAAFAFMGTLGTVLLGAVALARTVIVVGAIPLGAVLMYRLVRPRSPSAGPAFAAALAYAAIPIPRNAIANGRLGAIVLYALAPAILAALLRSSGMHPSGDVVHNVSGGAGSGESVADNASTAARRSWFRLVVLTAVATAFAPAAIGLVPVIVVALILALPVVGGFRLAGRALVVGAGAVVLALVLLAPWPFSFLSGGGDAASLGAVFSVEGMPVADILRFNTGPAGGGWLEWGILVAASFSLLVATRRRLAWAARAWVLALVGFALVWVPARFGGDVLVPSPDLLLIPAALGLAFAVGIGASAFVDDLPRFGFGWRQAAAVGAGVALVLSAVALVGASVSGRWEMPDRGWSTTLGFIDGDVDGSSFRTMWIGDPEILPVDPWVRDVGSGQSGSEQVGFGTTRDGTGDALELWPLGADEGANELLGDALERAADGDTARLGHVLAPMGVRYIVVPSRNAPGGVEGDTPDEMLAALDRQRDLKRRELDDDLILYENEVWIPLRAVVPDVPTDLDESATDLVPSRTDGEARSGELDDPLAVAERVDPGAFAVPLTGPRSGSSPAPPGIFLWGEAFDPDWSASADGESLEHFPAFGWSNGYDALNGGSDSISISYGGETSRLLLVAAEALAWFIVLALWWRTGRRRPATPEPRHAGDDTRIVDDTHIGSGTGAPGVTP